jgi:hypothetical protein
MQEATVTEGMEVGHDTGGDGIGEWDIIKQR